VPRVKITILKTTFHQDLVDEYIQDDAFKKNFGPCFVFEEGQTFISEDWPSKPEGFCERAWPNIPSSDLQGGANPGRDSILSGCCTLTEKDSPETILCFIADALYWQVALWDAPASPERLLPFLD